MSKNLWFTLSGLDEPDDRRCRAQWSLFWTQLRKIMPQHPIFRRADAGEVDLSRVAGLLLHGDEGRTKKKGAIMILSTHSILGKGSSHCASTEYAKQDLNFCGHTWATRWLHAVLPKEYYDKELGNQDAFDRILQHFADDANAIYENGVMSLNQQKHWVVVMGCMGDWPFLTKAFHLTRTFGHVAKAASSKAIPKGICHVCLADRPGYPWEDFESSCPRWRQTIGLESPFAQDPVLLQLPHCSAQPTSFIGQDLFHGFHLGCGKVFASSTIVLLHELFEGSSIPDRFEQMSAHFFPGASSENNILTYAN